MNDDTHNEPEGRILSFTDHLQELRVRIIICLAFFVITFIVSFFFAPQIVFFLMKPLIGLERGQHHGILTMHLAKTGEIDRWTVTQPSETLTTFPATFTYPSDEAMNTLAKDSFRIFIDGFPRPIEIGPKTQARLTYLTPLEPVFLWIQGALLMSSILSIPMVVYQFWLFISPGLLRKERGILAPLLGASILLFPLGATFAYIISRVVLGAVLAFGDQIPFLEPNLVASSYIRFILVMMFMFGLVFEFPLVLLLLSRLGFINSEKLVNNRKIAIVVMAVIAAVATPSPDPFSMLIMLGPLMLLYEGSIWAIKVLERRDRMREQAESLKG